MKFVISIAMLFNLILGEKYIFEQTNGPYGGGSNSIDIYNDTLFLSGKNGIWISPDNGDSWIHAGMASLNVIKTVVKDNKWIAATKYDKVWVSEDQGQSWVQKAYNIPYYFRIDEMALLDSVLLFGARDGGIHKSLDDDDSLYAVNDDIYYDIRELISTDSSFVAIAYQSSGRGIFTSFDYGNTWHMLDEDSLNWYVYNLTAYRNFVYGVDLISDRFVRSDDYGLSWQLMEYNEILGNGDIVTNFLAYEYGLIASVYSALKYKVYRTVDSGQNWDQLNINCKIKIFRSSGAGNTVVYLGSNKGMYRSFSPENNWTNIDTGRIASVITVLKSYNGVLFAGTAGAGIYRSFDGIQWVESNDGLNNWDIKNILFLHNTIYISTGGRGNFYGTPYPIYKSDNNGDDWQKESEGFGTPLAFQGNDLYIFRSNYVSGQYRLYRRAHGTTWLELNYPGYYGIKTLACVGSTIIAGPCEFWRSNDNGDTWSELDVPFFSSDCDYHLIAVDSTIFAVHNYISLTYASDDLGDSWYEVGVPPSNSAIRALTISNDTLYAGKTSYDKYGKGLIICPDGTNCYTEYDSALCMDITALAWFNGELYAGTSGGGVIKYQKKIVIEEPYIPDKIALNQNFPNPFNRSTTISFELDQKNSCQLNIYDICGRRIDRLFDKQFPVGVYSYNWDSRGHPSGVYIYELKTPSRSYFRKMILLK